MSEIEMERITPPTVQRRAGSTEVWSNSYRCNGCRDTGAVVAFKDNLPYAFSCDCQTGRSKRRAYPRWHSGLLKEYKLTGSAD